MDKAGVADAEFIDGCISCVVVVTFLGVPCQLSLLNNAKAVSICARSFWFQSLEDSLGTAYTFSPHIKTWQSAVASFGKISRQWFALCSMPNSAQAHQTVIMGSAGNLWSIIAAAIHARSSSFIACIGTHASISKRCLLCRQSSFYVRCCSCG